MPQCWPPSRLGTSPCFRRKGLEEGSGCPRVRRGRVQAGTAERCRHCKVLGYHCWAPCSLALVPPHSLTALGHPEASPDPCTHLAHSGCRGRGWGMSATYTCPQAVVGRSWSLHFSPALGTIGNKFQGPSMLPCSPQPTALSRLKEFHGHI